MRRPPCWLNPAWTPDRCVARARVLRELAALAYPRGLSEYADALLGDARAWEERGKGWARDAAACRLASDAALNAPTPEERDAAWERALALNTRVQAWAAGATPLGEPPGEARAEDRQTRAAGG